MKQDEEGEKGKLKETSTEMEKGEYWGQASLSLTGLNL